MSKRGLNVNPVPEIKMYITRYVVEPEKFRFEKGKNLAVKVYTCESVKKHIKKKCAECPHTELRGD